MLVVSALERANSLLMIVRELYRSMKVDGEFPLVESSARALGVRVPEDVSTDEDGDVQPGAGMSVTPDDPFKLPHHRRPEAFGGSGPDPVWRIDHEHLPQTLEYVQDAR